VVDELLHSESSRVDRHLAESLVDLTGTLSCVGQVQRGIGKHVRAVRHAGSWYGAQLLRQQVGDWRSADDVQDAWLSDLNRLYAGNVGEW
jgi:hypothetical protein